MFCPFCGAQQEDNAKFCTACGNSLEAKESAEPAPPPPGGAGIVPPLVERARTGAWISAGWDLVKQDLMLWALMTLVFLVIAGSIPFILQGALQAGLHYACMKRMLGRPIEFGDMFKGFQQFVATLLAVLLIAILTFLGTLACIIPGLVVAAMYMFTYLFIIDRQLEFWPAMQASHNIVKKDYFGFTIFLVALALLQVAGVLLCIVGILVTIPIAYAAITVAYRETVGFATAKLD